MPAELRNYQFELGDVVFGYDCPVDHETDVQPPAYALRTSDQAIPNEDGWTMGVDQLEPGSWRFKLFVNQDTEGEALDALEELAAAWRGDAYRKQPGKATALRYRLNNRTRLIYGRPRRFEAPLSAAYTSGAILITADFQALSDLFFDDSEEYLDVAFREPTTGGFVTPVTAPVSTEQSGVEYGPYEFYVAGVQATPAMVDFVGPLNDAGLLIDGVPFIQFQQDIPAGVTVTVDARPWVRSVRRSDGGGAAGLLSPRSRMPKMTLEPGVHSATLLGSTPTGTGYARVRWRRAYPSV